MSLNRVPGFRYAGGKYKLRKWIVPHFPKNASLFVEPFAGRGNVFWLVALCRPYCGYWINDIRTWRFFEAIRLVDISMLPSKITEVESTTYERGVKSGDLVSLVMEPMLYWGGGTAGDTTYVGGKYDAHGRQWVSYNQLRYMSKIMTCRALLNSNRVKVTGDDFSSLPWNDWDESVFAYFDPPYLESESIGYSDQDFDRESLISILKSAKFRWILSEYPHKFYLDRLGDPFDTIRTVTTIPRVSRQRVECLWSNCSEVLSRVKVNP